MNTTVVNIERQDTNIVLTLEDPLGRRRHILATTSGMVSNSPHRGISWTPLLSALGVIENDGEPRDADELYVAQDDGGTWGIVVFNKLQQILWLTAEGVVGGDSVVPWSSIVHVLESIPEA